MQAGGRAGRRADRRSHFFCLFTKMFQPTARIILLNANKHEREETKRLKKNRARYEFVLLVVIMSMMLSEINIAT